MILAELDALQNRYTQALDDKDMAGWVACFTEGSSYICNTREAVEQNLPIALMLDDNFGRIKDRANYVTEIWAGTFEDYSTRHFVHRQTCSVTPTGAYLVQSNLMVAYTNVRGQSQVLVAGVYKDEIVLGPQAAFLSKVAILDTRVIPRYLVYPI